MDKNSLEITIRQLCKQDELFGVFFTEEEIQKFLHDKNPFLARLISGSVKARKKSL